MNIRERFTDNLAFLKLMALLMVAIVLSLLLRQLIF